MSRRSRKIRRTVQERKTSTPPLFEPSEVKEIKAQPVLAGAKIRRTEIGSLNSDQLELDYSYQRPTEPDRVREIVSKFDSALVNLVKVSARDGHYYVFDGGHTLAALKKVNGTKSFPVLCIIYHGLTYEDEAILFAKQQGDAKKVGIPYKLRALEAAGDLETVDFLDRTRRSGFVITPGTRRVRNGNITAVKRAYDAYKQLGPERYERMMSLVKQTWNGEAWSVGQGMLGGLCEFYRSYGEVLREKRFVSKLSGVSRTAVDRDASGYYGLSVTIARALSIGKFYNRGGGYGTVDLSLLAMTGQKRGRPKYGTEVEHENTCEAEK